MNICFIFLHVIIHLDVHMNSMYIQLQMHTRTCRDALSHTNSHAIYITVSTHTHIFVSIYLYIYTYHIVIYVLFIIVLFGHGWSLQGPKGPKDRGPEEGPSHCSDAGASRSIRGKNPQCMHCSANHSEGAVCRL